MKKYLKRKMQDEMQDMQDVEVDMKDYLDIMLDVNEVDAKRQKISDSDVELDEESYLRIMLEDFDISTDGNYNIQDKDDGFGTSSNSRKGLTANIQIKKETSSPQMLTAKGRSDGFMTSSSSEKRPTANIQVKKDANSPWMLAANSTMDRVATTSNSGNVLTANINVNTKKVVDTENEKVKKPRDIQKMEGSIIEVSNSESILSDDDDFLVVATKVPPTTCSVFTIDS